MAAVKGLIARALTAIAEREQAMADKWSGTSDPHAAVGIDHTMTTMLKARAVCAQTLTPLAQRSVAVGDASVAAGEYTHNLSLRL